MILPDDLYREVKRIAREREMSLAEVMRRGLEYMEHQKAGDFSDETCELKCGEKNRFQFGIAPPPVPRQQRTHLGAGQTVLPPY